MRSPLPNSLLAVLAVVIVVAPRSTTADTERGAIVLVGGVLRYDNRVVWERIIELAGGTGAKIVVVPTATGRSRLYGSFAVRALQRYGAVADLLPVALNVSEFSASYEHAVQDPDLLAKVEDADGVFFTGGAPQHIDQALYYSDGAPTPLLRAIRNIYFDGGVIAGANAGNVAASTGVSASQALRAGLPEGALSRGLGVLEGNWFIDQHFFSRGRFAVTLVAMRKLSIAFGLGVGINAAMIVTEGRKAEVIGAPGAVFIDLSRARVDQRLESFNLTSARLSYLGSGDVLDLKTRQVAPAALKLEGFEVDPNAPDHQPWFEAASFYPDIFASSALVNLIVSAVDGRQRTGVGLAFAENVSSDEVGFRFRFYPGADTVAWLNDRSGSQDYTVSNVYLDVMPVTKKMIPHSLVEGYEAGR